jgi:hemolysin D
LANSAAETTRSLHDRQANAATKLAQLQAEVRKAEHKERLTQLTAPVDGVVQQLAINTVGGVATPAQALMVIVPGAPGQAAPVTAEVALANLDIGHVNPGQTAEIKLGTFPYTQYGTIAAKVQTVSADAVTDEKRGTDGKTTPGGAVFPALLTLERKTIQIDGKTLPLTPGMNLTAEIKTGKRRVIEYLLSPVQRAWQESLRER